MKSFMNILMLKNFMQIVQQVKQEIDFLRARNWKFANTMQHIKTIEKTPDEIFWSLRFNC